MTAKRHSTNPHCPLELFSTVFRDLVLGLAMLGAIAWLGLKITGVIPV